MWEMVELDMKQKTTKDHHDHMICLETGNIIEFFDEELENLQDQIAKKHGYKVVRHTHQLFKASEKNT